MRWVLLVLIFLFNSLAAQNINEFELINHVPNQISVVAIGDDILALGAPQKISLYDIREPDKPKLACCVSDAADYEVVKMQFQNSYLFYANLHNIRVYDISDPRSPILKIDKESDDEILDMVYSDGHLFVSKYEIGVEIWEVTGNFTQLNQVSLVPRPVDQEIYTLIVKDSLMFFQHFYHGRIYDISDITSPRYLSFFSPPDLYGGPVEMLDIKLDGAYLYAAVNYYGLICFDISDPAGPIMTDKLNTDDINSKKITLCDDYVLLHCADKRFVVNKSDPYNLEYWQWTSSVNFSNSIVKDSLVYSISQDSDLYLFIHKNTGTFSLRAEYMGCAAVTSSIISDDFLAVQDNLKGFVLYNMEPFHLPEKHSRYKFIPQQLNTMTRKGNFYYNGAESRFYILEYRTEYGSMINHGAIEIPSSVMLAEDSLLYISDSQHLTIFDISQPETPAELSSVFVDFPKEHIYKDDNLLYLLCGIYGVQIMDVANPESPEFITNFSYNWEAMTGAAAIDDYLYLSSYSSTGGALFTLNNSNPSNPDLISMEVGAGGYKLARRDNYLYTLFDGLNKIDITDRENPVLKTTMSLPAGGGDISLSDSLIAVSIWNHGVFIIRDNEFNATPVETIEENLSRFDLSQNYPNPFNASTTILFSLPNEELAEINIYNISGEKIMSTEFAGQKGNNKYFFDGANLASGIYLYSLKAGGFRQVRKMLLLK